MSYVNTGVKRDPFEAREPNDPVRPRTGVDLRDNYTKTESRQEMGQRLKGFMGTVSGNVHYGIVMGGYAPNRRVRNTTPIDGLPARGGNHARTAQNPYRVEVF